jgi:N-acetylmannosamine-6-phosphate 2-epimerase/N-acetylmannosamine kinase
VRPVDEGESVNIPEDCRGLEGKLIASCQAPLADVFSDPASMARFAIAAIAGGAAAIRSNGPDDVSAIRKATIVPIIGIQKSHAADGKVIITGTFEDAIKLVNAGATMIALDVTVRGQRYGALERIQRIKDELRVPVLADISNIDEALVASQAGADFVLSTLRGYTPETKHISQFDCAFIEALAGVCPVPIIAEGRIHRPDQAAAAIAAGAFAVVVGAAITRPGDIARWFSLAIANQYARRRSSKVFLAVDLGGTNTKTGLVAADGTLIHTECVATPALQGREILLHHLKSVSSNLLKNAVELGMQPAALGLATAGWIDVSNGSVAYATENLPGWTGTPIARELKSSVELAVFVENDANAFAVAEKHFGAGRGLRDFVSITLGTGVGGGIYAGGRLNRGAHYFANAFGHIAIEPGGRNCTCGQSGCLEAYCNSAALIRYAGSNFQTVDQIIAAATAGTAEALAAISTFAKYLARGCSTLVQLFDPEALVLAGGIAQNNPYLQQALAEELAGVVPVWSKRSLLIKLSPLGYYAGVLGAAAVAMEGLAGRGNGL